MLEVPRCLIQTIDQLVGLLADGPIETPPMIFSGSLSVGVNCGPSGNPVGITGTPAPCAGMCPNAGACITTTTHLSRWGIGFATTVSKDSGTMNLLVPIWVNPFLTRRSQDLLWPDPLKRVSLSTSGPQILIPMRSAQYAMKSTRAPAVAPSATKRVRMVMSGSGVRFMTKVLSFRTRPIPTNCLFPMRRNSVGVGLQTLFLRLRRRPGGRTN